MNIEDQLKEAQAADQTVLEAKLKQSNAYKAARDLVLSGQTTGDRQLDLAIILENRHSRDAGQRWFDFEVSLKRHPGELLLLQCEWEDVVVHRMIGGHTMGTFHADIVCIISDKPELTFREDGPGVALLPIRSFILLIRRDDPGAWEVNECTKPPSFAEMTSKIYHRCDVSITEGSYSIGNDKVSALMRAQLRDNFPSLLQKLGLEHFGTDGQGVFGIPGAKTAPDPA